LGFNNGAFNGILPNTGSYSNLVLIENGIVISHPFNVIGDASISGALTANSVDIESNLLVGGVNIITELETKQPTINDGDLTIAKTSGLQGELNALQPTINDGDLTIAKTSGLLGALNALQPTINDGDLTIAKTSGLQGELNALQPTINDGDLIIAKTSGLLGALNALQPTINNTIDITMKDLIANSAVINSVDIGSNLTSIQTQVDALINFTGGGVNFRASRATTQTFNSGSTLVYDDENFDTENTYEPTTGIYTIVIDGTYVFTFNVVSLSSNEFQVNLVRKRGEVEEVLQQITNGVNTADGTSYYGTIVGEVIADDEIFCSVVLGGVSLTSLTSFSGLRISG